MDERGDELMNQNNNDFLARLGLDSDPFPAETDSFYYENSDLMQRLDMIQHLIGFSNQMMFITGEQGIGKTSMLERLEYYAPDHWRICRIQANPMLNTPTLLRQLTSGFELEVSAGADDMFQIYSDALQDHIEALERAMLTPVVLIDDAHELPIDAFTMLFGFMQQEGGHSRLKMALFCEPQIIAMLDSPQLKTLSHNLTHQLEIPSFDEQQTNEYLQQRLIHAGLSNDFPFLPETVQKIHHDSQGVAGKIHTLAQQALLDESSQIDHEAGEEDSRALPVVDEILEFEEEDEETFPAMSTARASMENETSVGRKFHSWQIGAVAAVLALLAGVLWLTSQFSDDAEPTIAEEIPLDITPENIEPVIPQPSDPTLFEEAAPPSPEIAIVAPTMDQISDNSDTLADTLTNDLASMDQTSQEMPSAEETTIDPLDDFVQSMEASEHQQEPESGHSEDEDHQHTEVTVQFDENGNAQIVEVDRDELPLESPQPAQSAQSELPIAKTEPVPEPIPEAVIATVESPLAQVTEPQVAAVQPVAPKPEPVKPVSSPKPSISGTKDGSWLRTQNDSHVVLQLLGTHDQTALKKILRENPMGDDVAWFTTLHDGEPWYVVVKGPFKDRATATASIANLPAAMKKRKPWPRTIADVKKAMDKTQ